MMLIRLLKWLAAAFLALIILAALFIALFGWNWLRGPIERSTAEKTGRVLAVQGDLTVKFGWPWPRLRAESVTFANPDWAEEKQMLTADSVDITLDLSQLLRRKIVFPEVALVHPAVFLEQSADGRKSWLLDRNQQDEGARVHIDRLMLDQGTLGYDEPAAKTHIRSNFTTVRPPSGGTTDAGVTFSASGQYKGLALQAQGSGGPVLAIRDESLPYPLKIDGSLGKTSVKAQGTITSLLTFSAVDLRMTLRGESLDQLFPVLGIALPATPAYTTQGYLQRSGSLWRYEKFSGRVGGSDVDGSLQVDTSGKRPALTADINSNVLDLADLGPVIGSRPGSAAQAANRAAAGAPRPGRVLPDLPFKTDRWQTVDADVRLRAKTLRRAKELPLEDFVTHLTLRDAVLKLDPLNFGLAGGQLNTVMTLDGRQDPIQAQAQIRARKILLARLFPTVELSKTSIGQVNGDFDLAGQGNSVGTMLASANGKVGLVVANGEISRLMMEKVGLHLWEILRLSLTGDQQVKLRCAVANFDVRRGRMTTDALVFDTEVTTVIGTGSVDLGQETLDLTLNQKTKITSPVALRSPIYIRGNFAKPVVQVDTTRIATRALGALALGVVNPLLALMPLIDAGPGKDSECGRLIQEATSSPRTENPKTPTRK
jgi:AsmA protein